MSSDFNPFDGLAVGPYRTLGEQIAELAISQSGVREVGTTNTGKHVDAYARMCGKRTGVFWCGHFAGACLIEAHERAGIPRPYVSGRACNYFIKAEPDRIVERDSIFDDPNPSRFVGGRMVRARAGKHAARDAARIRRGVNVAGHVAIIIRVDVIDRIVYCKGGNSNGAGHSRFGGKVATEAYTPAADKHWAAIAGWVLPARTPEGVA